MTQAACTNCNEKHVQYQLFQSHILKGLGLKAFFAVYQKTLLNVILIRKSAGENNATTFFERHNFLNKKHYVLYISEDKNAVTFLTFFWFRIINVKKVFLQLYMAMGIKYKAMSGVPEALVKGQLKHAMSVSQFTTIVQCHVTKDSSSDFIKSTLYKVQLVDYRSQYYW